MSINQENPLIDCGKPLFFKVGNADDLGFADLIFLCIL